MELMPQGALSSGFPFIAHQMKNVMQGSPTGETQSKVPVHTIDQSLHVVLQSVKSCYTIIHSHSQQHAPCALPT